MRIHVLGGCFNSLDDSGEWVLGWLREIFGLRNCPGLVVGGGGVKVDTLVSGLTTMGG